MAESEDIGIPAVRIEDLTRGYKFIHVFNSGGKDEYIRADSCSSHVELLQDLYRETTAHGLQISMFERITGGSLRFEEGRMVAYGYSSSFAHFDRDRVRQLLEQYVADEALELEVAVE